MKREIKKIKPHQKITQGLNVYCENVESFWTKKEYTLQELIINAIVVHREPLDNSKTPHPYARIDIIYDSPNGIGRKVINGFEYKAQLPSEDSIFICESLKFAFTQPTFTVPSLNETFAKVPS